MAGKLILSLEFPSTRRVFAFKRRGAVRLQVHVKQRFCLKRLRAMRANVLRNGVAFLHVFPKESFRSKHAIGFGKVSVAIANASDEAYLARKRVRNCFQMSFQRLLFHELVAALSTNVTRGRGGCSLGRWQATRLNLALTRGSNIITHSPDISTCRSRHRRRRRRGRYVCTMSVTNCHMRQQCRHRRR